MTTINRSNALGAKVLQSFPFNGTEGEIAEGTSAVTLAAGGSYVDDATYGWQLHGDGVSGAASAPIHWFNKSVFTLRFSFLLAADAAGIGGMILETSANLGSNPGSFYFTVNNDNTINLNTNINGGGIDRTFPAVSFGVRHTATVVVQPTDSSGQTMPADQQTLLFIDGVSVSPTSSANYGLSGNVSTMQDNTMYVLSRANTTAFCHGYIEELTLFDGALTSAEIASLDATPDQIYTAAAVAPGFSSAPTIIGTPQVDTASSYSLGTMTGSIPITVTQQWTLDGVDIAGATGATYTPVAGDVGKALRVRQIATNTLGSSNNTSVPITVIAAGTVAPAPTSTTINIKTYGVGRDFTTPAALQTYIRNLDCVALGVMTVIYVYDNFDLTGLNLSPLKHAVGTSVVMYPAPGTGVNDGMTDAYTGDWGNKGITLTITSADFQIGYGMSVQGFRIRGTTTQSGSYTYLMQFNGGQSSGEVAEFAYNRVWLTSANIPYIFSSANNALVRCHDNYFLFDGAYAGSVWNSYGQVDVQRNTFVRTNGGSGTAALLNGANGTLRDNVILGFGPDVASGISNFSNRANNYVDTAQTTADTAVVYGTTAALVVSLTDARPATGSPIIGGGSSTAVSINDLRGGNRGPTPDAGAFQLVAATPLVVATVTSQVVDGQSLTISGTTTNAPTSSLFSLAPAAVPNGAQFYGPLTVTLGDGTFTVTLDVIATGSYVPSMSMTNLGGTSMVNGLAGFEIMGVESAAQDPVNAGPATAFTWIPPTTGSAGIASALFPVGVDGTLSQTVRFTPSDNGAGGTFSPLFLDLTPVAPSGTITYLRPTVGASTLTGAGSGLLNPPAVTYTAQAAQTSPAPTITVATADAAIMAGKHATLSGTVNFQGDATGHVDAFADPQPSGTPIPLGAANVSGSTWTKQSDLAPSLYRLRIVATANGQTASASTGNIRVLNLTGNFTLPAA